MKKQPRLNSRQKRRISLLSKERKSHTPLGHKDKESMRDYLEYRFPLSAISYSGKEKAFFV